MIRTLKRWALSTLFVTTVAMGMAAPADAANQYFRLRFDTAAGTASYRIAGVFQVAVDSLNFTSYVMEVDSRVGIRFSTITTFENATTFTSSVTILQSGGGFVANSDADDLTIGCAESCGLSVVSGPEHGAHVLLGQDNDVVSGGMSTFGASNEFIVGTRTDGWTYELRTGNSVTALKVDNNQDATFSQALAVTDTATFLSSVTVNAPASFTGSVGIGSGATTPAATLEVDAGISGTDPFLVGVSSFIIKANGNVGIGTDSPTRQLQLRSVSPTLELKVNTVAGSAFIRITSGGNNATRSAILFGDLSDDDVGEISYDHGSEAGDNQMYFRVNAARRMSIDSNGNVGIGTVSPGHKLDVLGTAMMMRMINGSPIFYMRREDTTIALNNPLADIRFTGDDASVVNTAGAMIRGAADSAWSSGDTPGRLEFHTVTDNTETLVERMRIDSAGAVTITGLAGTYTGGQASVCVTDAGVLFVVDGATCQP